jgi:hypothetical protein
MTLREAESINRRIGESEKSWESERNLLRGRGITGNSNVLL